MIMGNHQFEKTTSVRHLGKVDISSIKSDILALPQGMWEYETKKRENDFNCFHSTEHILFRFHHPTPDHTKFISKPLWNIWEQRLMPLIDEAVAPYNYSNGVIPKAMLAKLLPKSQIDRHVDRGRRNHHCHKIHIPIQTDEKVQFFIDDKPYALLEGQAYEVNNVIHHHVINDSEQSRIHFIFEYFDDITSI